MVPCTFDPGRNTCTISAEKPVSETSAVTAASRPPSVTGSRRRRRIISRRLLTVRHGDTGLSHGNFSAKRGPHERALGPGALRAPQRLLRLRSGEPEGAADPQ